ncbi:probable alpha,alpha-trehalose-phosphate synthase [UDP-forming] 7 [Tanacetum coccineum]
MSKSYSTNLVDLETGNLGNKRSREILSSDFSKDCSVSSSSTSSADASRLIIVSNQLPINTRETNGDGGSFWDFDWDESSLYMHIKREVAELPATVEVFYVGSLKAQVGPALQDHVSATLLENFNCVPVFLTPELSSNHYDGFCKQFLWPIFHDKLPLLNTEDGQYDPDLWDAYTLVNKEFFKKVTEVVNDNTDYVWIHDYHLMILPTFLRRDFCRYKIGFFLHSPFPSWELFKSIPAHSKILRGLLNADLIGFHTFDYARNFMSCCSRMFGLGQKVKRGDVLLEYNGRYIKIKIMPSGIHVGTFEDVLNKPDTKLKIEELQKQFDGKTVLLSVDDLDIFKGVNLKILAMGKLLESHPTWQGKAVLVQILNPARGRGLYVAEIESEIGVNSQKINTKFGSQGYVPVLVVDSPISLTEKAAYYAVSEAVVVTPVRDGMNLIPYEYVVCRNRTEKSMIVVSECVGCSRSLSKAIQVNPWDVSAIAEGMNAAISASDHEKEYVHEVHNQYIRSHDVINWSHSFFTNLVDACTEHAAKRCKTLGLGLNSRIMLLDRNFRLMDTDILQNAYRGAKSRAILLPFLDTEPSENLISVIKQLCDDPKNTVCVISGCGKESLGTWFDSCGKLAVAAEHGYFMRRPGDAEWKTCGWSNCVGWMENTELTMNVYGEAASDGSYIERKESAMVWHYKNAGEFGQEQAKHMLEHLEKVLANVPVAVKHGQDFVEVKPKGVNKGTTATKISELMAEVGRSVDFVLGIGDDTSDEDVFVAIHEAVQKRLVTNNGSVFSCTVGEKPSIALIHIMYTSVLTTSLAGLRDSCSKFLSQLPRDSKSYEMSSHGDNLDRLSSLPEELISNILSLMPTKFAVQTCILSKRWIYSWTFVHNLDLDFDDFYHGNRFSKFMDQALELFNPFQVKKIRMIVFSLCIPTSVVLKWISKAVTFNVSELDIEVTDVELPLSLFTCKTLTKFRLHYSYPQFSLPDCVSSINLPNLITLDINVASEPFYDAVKPHQTHPMLSQNFLKSISKDKMDLSSLVEANVSCRVRYEYVWVELLKVISEAKFLSLTTKFWMSFNDQSQWPKFPNLKRLKLQGCAKAGRSWQLIPQFLERCSVLEYFSVEKPNAGVWVEPLSIPTCMPMKLKTMRYSKTKGDLNDIQFLRFILSNSKALKTLTVDCDATLSSKEEEELLAELSNLDRGSRDCQIHFVGSLSLKKVISCFEKRSASAMQWLVTNAILLSQDRHEIVHCSYDKFYTCDLSCLLEAADKSLRGQCCRHAPSTSCGSSVYVIRTLYVNCLCTSSDADTTSYPELLLTCPDQQQTLLDTAPYMSRGDIAPYMSRTDTTPYMSTLLLTCHGQLLTC